MKSFPTKDNALGRQERKGHKRMKTLILEQFLFATTLAVFVSALNAQQLESGFTAVFDGETLKGWHISSQTGHSRASGNKSGGRWVVENGAIIGSQDIPGNGGIVITD